MYELISRNIQRQRIEMRRLGIYTASDATRSRSTDFLLSDGSFEVAFSGRQGRALTLNGNIIADDVLARQTLTTARLWLNERTEFDVYEVDVINGTRQSVFLGAAQFIGVNVNPMHRVGDVTKVRAVRIDIKFHDRVRDYAAEFRQYMQPETPTAETRDRLIQAPAPAYFAYATALATGGASYATSRRTEAGHQYNGGDGTRYAIVQVPGNIIGPFVPIVGFYPQGDIDRAWLTDSIPNSVSAINALTPLNVDFVYSSGGDPGYRFVAFEDSGALLPSADYINKYIIVRLAAYRPLPGPATPPPTTPEPEQPAPQPTVTRFTGLPTVPYTLIKSVDDGADYSRQTVNGQMYSAGGRAYAILQMPDTDIGDTSATDSLDAYVGFPVADAMQHIDMIWIMQASPANVEALRGGLGNDEVSNARYHTNSNLPNYRYISLLDMKSDALRPYDDFRNKWLIMRLSEVASN